MDREPRPTLPSARLLRYEVATVLLVALLPPVVASLYSLAKSFLAVRAPTEISVGIRGHIAVDVVLQCLLVAAETVAVLLVLYVLARSGETLRNIGLSADRLPRDCGFALLLTGATIMLALTTRSILGSVDLSGIHRNFGAGVGPAYVPVGLMMAIRAGLLEEIVVCGYLLYRLRQLGWSNDGALSMSVAVRASYHLYGGIPLVIFTILFGLIIGRVYQRTQRLSAIVFAHVMYDALILTVGLLWG